jgi:hypothetical protein
MYGIISFVFILSNEYFAVFDRYYCSKHLTAKFMYCDTDDSNHTSGEENKKEQSRLKLLE